jgi:hypothetical protein
MTPINVQCGSNYKSILKIVDIKHLISNKKIHTRFSQESLIFVHKELIDVQNERVHRHDGNQSEHIYTE